MWYEKDFSYRRKPGTRVFFRVGAANYRSYVWVNGQKVCEHEDGFTPFDCEVTGLLKDGRNFVVMTVDNTRLADGIPTPADGLVELWRPHSRCFARRSAGAIHRRLRLAFEARDPDLDRGLGTRRRSCP